RADDAQVPLRAGRLFALEQHLGATPDHVERRCDLVGESGGEGTERGHLLGLTQATFESQSLFGLPFEATACRLEPVRHVVELTGEDAELTGADAFVDAVLELAAAKCTHTCHETI